MQDRRVIDHLRGQYFDHSAEIERVLAQLEAEIRSHTLSILHDWREPEELAGETRIRGCESAIDPLLGGNETNGSAGRRFDPDRIDEDSLLNLPDWAGLRALVFPSRRLGQADQQLRPDLSNWAAKPVKSNKGKRMTRAKCWGPSIMDSARSAAESDANIRLCRCS
jgi:hypothetical protein